MANYYFLATLLPPLRVGAPVEISSKELQYYMEQNLKLTPKDLAYFSALKRLVDIDNIRSIWLNGPFMPGGEYDQYELEDALFYRIGLPSYVLEYLEQFPEKNERLQNFPLLLHRYLACESQSSNPFVRAYLTFEWHWRLVFVAIRALDLGRDVDHEFRYEDPEDPFVADLIARAKEKTFEAPAPYNGLKALYESRKQAPLDLYQALSEWRFNYIEELIEWDFFSLERILGYVAQLEICEQWLQLDKLKGLEIVEEMMEVV